MHVLLINDTSAWYHFGCTATSAGLRRGIGEIAGQVSSIPITTVMALRFPEGGARLDDRAGFEAFRALNAGRGFGHVFHQIAAADVVVINGEGSIHHMTGTAAMLLYLAHVAHVRFGRPVQIVNHSAYPAASAAAVAPGVARLYARVYRDLDFVAIREGASRALMRAVCGIDATASFDALVLEAGRFAAGREPGPRAGVVVSDSVVLRNVAARARFADLAGRLAGAGWAVSFPYGAVAHPARETMALLEDLVAQPPPGALRLVQAVTLRDWFAAIDRAEAVVTGRFHMAMAAIFLGVPTLLYASNTPKSAALVEGLARPLPPFDPAAPDFAERVVAALGPPGGAAAVNRLDAAGRADWLAAASRNFDGLRALARTG